MNYFIERDSISSYSLAFMEKKPKKQKNPHFKNFGTLKNLDI